MHSAHSDFLGNMLMARDTKLFLWSDCVYAGSSFSGENIFLKGLLWPCQVGLENNSVYFRDFHKEKFYWK